jgi:hypothetical protein
VASLGREEVLVNPRNTLVRVALTSAGLAAFLAAPACNKASSPTEPSTSGQYVIQVGGGLYNASGNATITQLQVFLDGKPIQTTSYGSPTNLAEINFGASTVYTSKGMHTLALKPTQNVASARYQSYAVAIMVFNNVGGIAFQSTPADQFDTLSSSHPQLEISFGPVP